MIRSHFALGMVVIATMAASPAPRVTLPNPRAQLASIAGRVIYGGGGGVVVSVLPASGGNVRETTSGDQGEYQFADLPDGEYRLDFDLPGYDVIRHHHVQVRRPGTVNVNVTMRMSSVCECVDVWADLGGALSSKPVFEERQGQVVDEAGRPLPHAQLEIVSPVRKETRYADREGRFQIRLVANQTWPLTARDSGFGAVTQQVSTGMHSPLVFRLPMTKTGSLPAMEPFTRGCRCPGDLFAHRGR